MASDMKRAVQELRALRQQLDEMERAAREPIAVIGMAGRFPGADTLEAFWALLREGHDAITEIPSDRWNVDAYYDPDPAAAGKAYVRRGGFVRDVSRFDARFFGISPREASSMDPQQRLLLEVAWEALEDAGVVPARIERGAGGVFVGISNADYAHLHTRAGDQARIDTYEGTGNAFSFASGRLSYVLGWHGPSVSVDTACSSSLVAVHLAGQSLRAGECDVALAGGVNLILSPDSFIRACKNGMLAPDGRCKTFDAAADGYARGEGCGVVVLKRLSAALAAGDRVLAVIRGSAVNQDGRTGGLTVPNGAAQQALIRRALASADVAPHEIAYVEAHGTGTALGDPIEVNALAAALGVGRGPERRLWLGSAKTNIGHLESAAGIAGLIKTILALRHREIPPHLHYRTPSPHIAWDALPIGVAVARRPWPAGPLLAGVSSFGFSGTNAHVIVEAAPEVTGAPACTRPVHVLTLSARSDGALAALADRYAERLGAPDRELADACFSANVGRSTLEHRLAVVGRDAREMQDRLRAWRAGAETGGVLQGHVERGRPTPDVAFLFPGQGAQYAGMGRALYASSATFRAAVTRVGAALGPEWQRRLETVIRGEGAVAVDETATAQVALFAVQWGLAEVWRSWGIRPAAVVGHSVGEFAAACVAEVVDVEAAARMVAERGRLMGALPAGGRMVAVEAQLPIVTAAIEAVRADGLRDVGIAAINGPDSLVVSGEAGAVAAVEERLAATGARTRALRVSHAFHSTLMAPMQAPFGGAARLVQWGAPRVTWVSTVTGRVVKPGETDVDYWVRQVREPVQFAAAMETVSALGVEAYVEVGPGTTLLGLGRRCLDGTERVWTPSLRAGRDDWEQMLESLAQLWSAGVPVDWDAFDREGPRRRVSLPTYPWQGGTHWLGESAPAERAHRTPLDRETAWTAVVTAGRIQAAEAPLDLDLAGFPRKWQALDRLSTAYIVEALRRLRVFGVSGETHTADGLRASHGIAPTYRHLLSRWLRRLAALGLLSASAETFVARRPLPDLDLASALAEAREALRDIPALHEYVERCGGRLVEILTGAASPLETLFPDGSLAPAEALYRDWALSRYFSALVRSMVVARAGQAAGAPLRVIEIGAGTGGTTAALLPALPADRTAYWFTDVSTAFLARAEQAWSSYGFVRYGILDIERDPTEQGFPSHGFDVLIATNVVHATRDIPDTLGRARSLLAPGGLLILCEATTHLPWFDVTTGLIEGWQRFDESARDDSPLLSAADWRGALERAGFDAVVALPESGSPAEILGQHVVIARTPGEAQPAAAVVSPRIERASVGSPAGTPVAAETARRLREALPADRSRLAVEFVAAQVAAVLRVARAEALDPRQPLMDLGLDSLMAVELRSRLALGLELGAALPATLVFEHPNIEAIAGLLVRMVAEANGAPFTARAVTPSERAAAVSEAAARIAELSEDEVEALLVKKLESL